MKYINNNKIVKYNDFDKHKVKLMLLQMMYIKKAMNMGWSVKSIESNKIVFCKKINEKNNIDTDVKKLMRFLNLFNQL